MKPLVSIIVPVYKVPECFLRKCIESLINQTLENIEIILVDDGSPDNCGQVCDSYGQIDQRIKVIHKENEGLSSARNIGILNANGKWTMFVDGDDWIDNYCIERCINSLKDNTDIILFPYIREYYNKSIKNDIFNEDEINFNSNQIRNYLLKRIFGLNKENIRRPDRLEDISSAWGKLYKTDLIKKEKFIDTKKIRTEDIWFNVNVFFKATNVVFIKKTYYHYNKENISSLTNQYDSLMFERRCNLYKLMNNFIIKNNLSDDFYEALNNRIIINLLGLNRRILNSDLRLKEKLKELDLLLSNEIYKKAFENFPFNKLSFKWRVYYVACYNKNLYLVLAITKVAEILKKYIK